MVVCVRLLLWWDNDSGSGEASTGTGPARHISSTCTCRLFQSLSPQKLPHFISLGRVSNSNSRNIAVKSLGRVYAKIRMLLLLLQWLDGVLYKNRFLKAGWRDSGGGSGFKNLAGFGGWAIGTSTVNSEYSIMYVPRLLVRQATIDHRNLQTLVTISSVNGD